MNLDHAPCGGAAGLDRGYPYSDGRIGTWGYDFLDGGRLVAPSRADLMAYCRPRWISDYHFTNALRYRLVDEGAPAKQAAVRPVKALLLWGGIDADSIPFLEPAFVVDARPELPQLGGEYQLTGQTEGGIDLFSLTFIMPDVADGDGSSSFVFALPVEPSWAGSLASITLSRTRRLSETGCRHRYPHVHSARSEHRTGERHPARRAADGRGGDRRAAGGGRQCRRTLQPWDSRCRSVEPVKAWRSG